MLVLSRREKERIVIQADEQTIVIEVCHVYGDKVRLGITAEKSVAIYRAELLEKDGRAGR